MRTLKTYYRKIALRLPVEDAKAMDEAVESCKFDVMGFSMNDWLIAAVREKLGHCCTTSNASTTRPSVFVEVEKSKLDKETTRISLAELMGEMEQGPAGRQKKSDKASASDVSRAFRERNAG